MASLQCDMKFAMLDILIGEKNKTFVIVTFGSLIQIRENNPESAFLSIYRTTGGISRQKVLIPRKFKVFHL